MAEALLLGISGNHMAPRRHQDSTEGDTWSTASSLSFKQAECIHDVVCVSVYHPQSVARYSVHSHWKLSKYHGRVIMANASTPVVVVITYRNANGCSLRGTDRGPRGVYF